MTGFVVEELNTSNMLQEILAVTDSSKKENKQIEVYANQWRFRSTRGLTHNSNYYYNTGSLDGNMILSQFIDVITSYEILGVQVLGIVSDGGGSNTKFFNTLFTQQIKYGSWPTKDSVCTVNPANMCQMIMYWYCAPHGLKAIRNTLFRSQSNMSRDLTLNGRKFG